MNWKCELGMISTQMERNNKEISRMPLWARYERMHNCEVVTNQKKQGDKQSVATRTVRHRLALVLRGMAEKLEPVALSE